VAREVVWARRARSDLRLAISHIQADSPTAARTFASAIIQSSRSLATLSERGRVVPELGQEEVRELLLGRYRLVYEVFPARVAVVRLIHASRDFLKAWRGGDRS
jgi:plasmid stabilization system protein ParE